MHYAILLFLCLKIVSSLIHLQIEKEREPTKLLLGLNNSCDKPRSTIKNLKRERESSNLFVGYALKADIRHYFDNINHCILLRKIREKITDEKVIWLIELILKNHITKIAGKGMPLGNLTSQFFANVYLNEFDHFVKEKLNTRYYIRYVDDFVILHKDKKILEKWKNKIDCFLKEKLRIEIHPEKTRIIELRRGITFLGFRIFQEYRLLKKSNTKRIWKRLEKFKKKYDKGEVTRAEVLQRLEGWLAYAKFANTYRFRKRVMANFNELFGQSWSFPTP